MDVTELEMGVTETELRLQLTELSRLAYHRGFVSGSGGNASVRIPGGDFLITAGGSFLKDTTPENVIKVSGDGTPLSALAGSRPSQETGFHAAIYERRPRVGGICHFHPPHGIVVASMDALPSFFGYFHYLLTDIVVIPPAPAGSDKLRGQVIEAVEAHPDCRFFLMARHGIIALGETLQAAFDLADRVEFAFQQEFIHRNWN